MALTLTQKRNKANALFTPIWVALQKAQVKMLSEDGVYKNIPLTRVALPYETDRLEAGFEVVADGADGYTAIAYINHDANGYVRKQGHGTGETVDWSTTIPTIIPEQEEMMMLNCIKLDANRQFCF